MRFKKKDIKIQVPAIPGRQQECLGYLVLTVQKENSSHVINTQFSSPAKADVSGSHRLPLSLSYKSQQLNQKACGKKGSLGECKKNYEPALWFPPIGATHGPPMLHTQAIHLFSK